MPNYKGVEVPHVIQTEDDVVLHAAAQGSADAVIYANAEVSAAEAPTESEPMVGEAMESSEIAEESSAESAESSSEEAAQPEARKGGRRRRGS